MSNEDMTRDKFKEVIEGGGVISQLLLALSPITSLEILGDALTLKQTADRLREDIERPGPPEHTPLVETARATIEAVDKAYERAIDTAYAVWIIDHRCQCVACRVRKQRAKADQN